MTTANVKADLDRASARGQGARGIGQMARSIVGSEILKIAAEIREMQAAGAKILNLTVGDFAPKEFPIPETLHAGIVRALAEGHTNYPPSEGVKECREAVRGLFKRRLGLEYPLEGVLIGGGARPMIATTYLALVNPGDRVVYNLPSWNNNHYCTLSGAVRVEVPTRAENGFLPTAKDVEPYLSDAKLLCVNTPQNPSGTVMERGEVASLARLVVDENRRRESAGRPGLFLMFDQVYWMLTFGNAAHHDPVSLLPEAAPYAIFIDGISKAMAATGLRVGWAVGPPDVVGRMSAILTHLGAWAPRAEQVATARMLDDDRGLDSFLGRMKTEVLARLEALSAGIRKLKSEGFDVDAIPPAGAIYLSMRIAIAGRTAADGTKLETDEDVRAYLLREAGLAVVPFQAFGLREDTGWFRASVGAVSKADCEGIGPRLRGALSKLR